MKNSNILKRNTLAVRLEDEAYEEFLKYAGTHYSLTLRRLINDFIKLKKKEERL